MRKLLLFLLLAVPAFAQNSRYDSVALGPRGPIPNTSIAVCTQPANTTTTPCSPLANLCSSLTDATCISPNPVTADSLGNYHFYGKPTQGPFTIQLYGPQVAAPVSIPDQTLGGSGSSIAVKSLDNILFADQWCTTSGTLDQSCITNAINALPTCAAQDGTWNHCGTVIVGNGIYSLASAVAITSPFVSIRGQGPVSTLLNYSGTGCAFTFTASPFNTSPGDSNPSPNISDLKIAYTGASTGVCAINYFDIIGFNAQNVTVWGFNTSGSSGIWANAVTHFNERPKINATIGNCTTDFLVTAQPTASGYPNTTFGYGKFDLWLNTQGTQTAFSQTAGIISYSNIHILNNASGAGNVGVALATNAKWFSNVMNVHIEGSAAMTGFSLDATSSVRGIGSVERGALVTDSIAGGGIYAVLSTEGTPDTTLPFSLSNFGSLAFAEGTPSGATAGFSVCQSDSTAHALKCSYNNGSFFNVPQVIGSGTATMTTAAITAGNCGTTVTVAATGVATTDTITWAFNAAPAGSNAGLVAWPTANNVNFAYCPNTAETPAAATINWRVIR